MELIIRSIPTSFIGYGMMNNERCSSLKEAIAKCDTLNTERFLILHKGRIYSRDRDFLVELRNSLGSNKRHIIIPQSKNSGYHKFIFPYNLKLAIIIAEHSYEYLGQPRKIKLGLDILNECLYNSNNPIDIMKKLKELIM